MIAQLTGTLARKAADRVIIDIQGVGYEVHIPFSTYYELGEEGSPISLRIHTHVREDALSLYGFHAEKEKSLFVLLIQISGIGPRLAVAILSGLPTEELISAVARADVRRLSSIPGVGKKTAERISLELKDKISALAPAWETASVVGTSSGVQADVVSALVNLGYVRAKAEAVVSVLAREGEESFEGLLKMALRKFSG